MNKYLEKVAEILSDENKQVAKTFAVQTAAALPSHLVGLAAGGALGKRYLGGAAKSINRGVGRTAGRIGSSKVPGGRWLASQVRKAKGLNGMALGGVIGMNVAGGLADLGALKHGFHGKVKSNE